MVHTKDLDGDDDDGDAGSKFSGSSPLVLQYHAANFSGQVDFCIFGVVFGIFYDISSYGQI